MSWNIYRKGKPVSRWRCANVAAYLLNHFIDLYQHVHQAVPLCKMRFWTPFQRFQINLCAHASKFFKSVVSFPS